MEIIKGLLLLIFIALVNISNSLSAVTGAAVKQKHAIIIGIEKYGNKLFKNESAVNDAEMLAESLTYREFKKENLMVLRNDLATEKILLHQIELLLTKLRAGDCVHFHFSGLAIPIILDGSISTSLAMYDSPIGSSDGSAEGLISKLEVENILSKIATKIGKTGQLIITINAPFNTVEFSSSTIKHNWEGWTRTGFEIQPKEASPDLLFFGNSSDTLIIEERNNQKLSLWCLAYAFVLTNTNIVDAEDYQKNIEDAFVKFNRSIANTWFIGNKSAIPYWTQTGSSRLQKVNPSNFYVVSIGVDQYNIPSFPMSAFSNCSGDANRFKETFDYQFNKYQKGESNFINAKVLTNKEATLSNIESALNEVINKATKNDFFFFNFAGFTSTFTDSLGITELYFFPYSEQEIQVDYSKSTLSKLPKEAISLRHLRNLLVFIPCQYQLIVSEAGSSELFTNLFTKAMIETSPSIMEIESRNRVIIVPRQFGYNNTNCHSESYDAGPISHFLSLLSKQTDVTTLFNEERSSRQTIAYQLLKLETACGYQRPYMEIFFERDIIDNLQFYLKDAQPALTRGGRSASKPISDSLINRHFNKKYALVIGTNNYSNGKPTWSNLNNPIADATEIGNLLTTKYGYEVAQLTNPTANDIIKAMEAISIKIKSNDQFIFFVAGHGDYDSVLFDDGFLVLSESLSKSKDPYRRTYLPFSTISNIIDNLKCNQTLLIADVCFGGVFDRKLKTNSRSENGVYDDMDLEEIIGLKGNKRTRIVLTSGSINVVPDGYLGKHSPFAARLISALESGGGSRGILTSTQMYDMVQFLPSKPFKGELSRNDFGSEFFIISAELNN